MAAFRKSAHASKALSSLVGASVGDPAGPHPLVVGAALRPLRRAAEERVGSHLAVVVAAAGEHRQRAERYEGGRSRREPSGPPHRK